MGKKLRNHWIIAALIIGVSLIIAAARPALAQQDFSKVEITTTKLSDTLYMLTGEGGNIGVSAGADGLYLIDDQYAPLSEKILAALKAISDKPVKYVINTHWHGDHVGGNENFNNLGAAIIAHQAVRARMEKGQHMAFFNMTVPPAPAAALPSITYRDGMVLHLNGEAAKIIHIDPAHTDGDSIIHWPSANVIHTGDAIVKGRYPFIDIGSGGKFDGVIKAAETVMALADAATKIVPGHGPLASRADVAELHNMLVTVRARVLAAKAAGQTLQQWVAAKPLADFDATWGQGFIKPDQFAQIAFEAL